MKKLTGHKTQRAF